MTTSENNLALCGKVEISESYSLAIPIMTVTRKLEQVCTMITV